MNKNYFDLTGDNDITTLIIKRKDSFNCQLIDTSGKIYDGFILAKSPGGKVLTVCDIDFHKSDTDKKYQARLIFRKTDAFSQSKNIRQGSKQVIIPFRHGKDGYRAFWKMIAFLYKWRNLIDIGMFEDYFVLTNKNLIRALFALAKIENKKLVLESLEKIPLNNLQYISDLIGIAKIRNTIDIWNRNKNNNDEKFWQNFFKENSYILSQVFACPFIFIQNEFFVGGKRGTNRGGVKTDFIYQNILTRNIAFIEIKTPQTTIVNSSLYLGKHDTDNNAIYSISSDLTGGVNELLNQCNLFIQKKDSLEETSKNSENFKCILIAGQISTLTQGQLKSFELYRGSLRNVEIITYDELFEKVIGILSIFNG